MNNLFNQKMTYNLREKIKNKDNFNNKKNPKNNYNGKNKIKLFISTLILSIKVLYKLDLKDLRINELFLQL